jgi:hypothetical protein
MGAQRKKGLDGRLLWYEVEISDWVFNAIRANEVLTLNRDYFRLRKPIERRIYEIARKHCGRKKEWSIGLALLHKKSGSQGNVRLFKQSCNFVYSSFYGLSKPKIISIKRQHLIGSNSVKHPVLNLYFIPKQPTIKPFISLDTQSANKQS